MSDQIINGVRVPFVPVGGVNGTGSRNPMGLPDEQGFKSIFDKELQQIKFSKHAQQRLDSRNIALDESDKTKIQSAVTLAEKKGAQDSLVFLRDMAFIVNIKNKTIVTAIDRDAMKENVFTNIDSAIVAG
ncbi:MAG: TIGR02530 family flagellar biosynthesis protein [Bacteroidota bacterium]|jgi:flagellar operon protein